MKCVICQDQEKFKHICECKNYEYCPVNCGGAIFPLFFSETLFDFASMFLRNNLHYKFCLTCKRFKKPELTEFYPNQKPLVNEFFEDAILNAFLSEARKYIGCPQKMRNAYVDMINDKRNIIHSLIRSCNYE